jgi:hypothetical protein
MIRDSARQSTRFDTMTTAAGVTASRALAAQSAGLVVAQQTLLIRYNHGVWVVNIDDIRTKATRESSVLIALPSRW